MLNDWQFSCAGAGLNAVGKGECSSGRHYVICIRRPDSRRSKARKRPQVGQRRRTKLAAGQLKGSAVGKRIHRRKFPAAQETQRSLVVGHGENPIDPGSIAIESDVSLLGREAIAGHLQHRSVANNPRDPFKGAATPLSNFTDSLGAAEDLRDANLPGKSPLHRRAFDFACAEDGAFPEHTDRSWGLRATRTVLQKFFILSKEGRR